jgi:hypothetical protein
MRFEYEVVCVDADGTVHTEKCITANDVNEVICRQIKAGGGVSKVRRL